MKELRKYKERKKVRRLLCVAAAIAVLAGLSVIAFATRTEEFPCPGHQQHDEMCGYREATDGTEGHPCEHVCEICDPVLELEKKKGDYDKYIESESHQEVKIIYKKNHDSLEEINTYVYNEDGARLQDEQGEWVKVTLNKNIDYTILSVPENEEFEQIVLKDTYVDSLYNLPYIFNLEFKSGNTKEYELKVDDTTPMEQPEENAENLEEPGEEAGLEEDTPALYQDEENSKAVGAYTVSQIVSSMAEDDTTYRFTAAESNGMLQITANLETSGETGRYVLIELPAYGMVLTDTLPGTGGGITQVTKIDERTLRLDIADTVNEILNIQISYKWQNLTKEMELNWRKGIVPGATGFKTSVYGTKSGVEQELASNTYGNWKIDTSGTDAVVSGSPSYVLWPDIQGVYTGNVLNLNSSGWPESPPAISMSFPLSSTKYGMPGSESLMLSYLKSIKLYGDPKVLAAFDTNVFNQNSAINAFGYVPNWDIQKDAEGYYYEITLPEDEMGCTNSVNSTQVGFFPPSSIGYYTRLYNKEAAKLTPNTTYPMKMVWTIGRYTESGVADTKRTIDLSLKTREVVNKDLFKPGFNNSTEFFQPAQRAAVADNDENIKTAAGTYTESLMSFKNAACGLTRLNPTAVQENQEDLYEGLTEEYEFPYEIQPTEITFPAGVVYVFQQSKIEQVYYELSNGVTGIITASDLGWAESVEEIGEDTSYTASFNVPDGVRVTKVKITWEKYYQTHSMSNNANYLRVDDMGALFSYKVAEGKEDGSDFESGYHVNVGAKLSKKDGTVLAESTANDLNFYFKNALHTCPRLTHKGNNKAIGGLLSEEGKTSTYTVGAYRENYYTIEKAVPGVNYVMSEIVKNPKVTVRWRHDGANISGLTDEELVGYSLSGTMKVYPVLAGWKVTYHTRNLGEQSFTLPDDIPEEGYTMVLPVEDNDRLVGFTSSASGYYSVVEISKDGDVSGWKAAQGKRAIGSIEYIYPQQTDDGRDLDGGVYDIKEYEKGTIDLTLTNDTCTGTDDGSSGYNHQHVNPSAQTTSMPIYTVFDSEIRMDSQDYFGKNADSIYQDGKAEVSVGGTIQLQNPNVNVSPKTWSGVYGDGALVNAGRETALRQEFNPVVYAKIDNPDMVYIGDDATIEVSPTGSSPLMSGVPQLGLGTPPVVSVPAEVSIIQDNSGASWIRMEAKTSISIEDVFKLVNDNVLNSVEYERMLGVGTLYASIRGKTNMYAYAGAALGSSQPVFGDVYIEEDWDGWRNAYQNTPEDHYTKLEIDGLVPDTLDLRGTGDTVTPSLYYYHGTSKIAVLQKVFVGISLIPGIDSSYAVDTRSQNIYPYNYQNVSALVNVSTGNDNLKNHISIYELPRKGKSITGNRFGGTTEETLESQFDLYLRGPVTVVSNPAAASPVYEYRIGGSWCSESQVAAKGGWTAVDAVKITMPDLRKSSAISFSFPLETNSKTDTDILKSYMGGTYEYTTEGGASVSDMKITLAEFIYYPYTVSGHVFLDKDENGTQDGAEAGEQGVTVNLKNSRTNVVLATAVTDASGNFMLGTLSDSNLCVEIVQKEGQKCTLQSSVSPEIADDDSDFDRDTNQCMLENPLTKGSYTLSAGVINLPVLEAPDVVVRMETPVNTSVTCIWDGGTPSLQFEQAEDIGIVTVDSLAEGNTGALTPVAPGETKAKVWVENSLGDRVEKTYNITVIPREVTIDLTKQLTEVADSDYSFIFKFERLADDGSTIQTFYQTMKIPMGSSSAVISVKELVPGNYKITELDSNWRYEVQGAASQNTNATNPDEATEVTFINKYSKNGWVSDNSVVTNTMNRVMP
ncbi:hypothetical protein NE683_08045 [Bariatricus massiliensis]|uniref:SD-repeat containing protein B domain-containing protein n=1 Tax=Bariatricus massiliensis TaxID=1745713 RepID=A0ABS8DJT4_9FIRM|nr:SdrD B-like domain-containing protein [Bariatricus massiliensis]MCB7305632.1 hypothetical protein [Bariatricus massiliensis]MCB7376186.1 hypothetical protein [Bariatricus massiliensis]MCB7388700.1 hypothetical protein [Bariatricus massiliensis]MCB7412873.1 hypothetical protein [Bariatricus massiliensis]MCQ5253179.1 hypothetical protein [Bariatricus massiliensis]